MIPYPLDYLLQTSILGMIQISLFNGLIYFNRFPGLMLALDYPNILQALNLNILTSGYEMIDNIKPLTLIYHIYYRLLKTTLDPKVVLQHKDHGSSLLIQSSTPDAKVQTPKTIQWKDITLPGKWILEQEVPSAKVISDDSNLDYIQQYLESAVKISFDQLNLQSPITIFISHRFSTGSRSLSNISEQQHLDDNLKRCLEESAQIAEPSPILKPPPVLNS